jgi:hypothetical protein
MKTDGATRLPVYVLNALYLAPITLWTYLKYGRPMTPAILKKWIEDKSSESGIDGNGMSGHMHMMQQEGTHGEKRDIEKEHPHEGKGMRMANEDMGRHNLINPDGGAHGMDVRNELGKGEAPSEQSHKAHAMSVSKHVHHEGPAQHQNPERMDSGASCPEHRQHDQAMPGNNHMHHMDMEHGKKSPDPNNNMANMQHGTTGHNMSHMKHNMANDPHMFHMMQDRPMFATITVAVCHCGAGCLLGDIVGEWLVYGTNAQINGKGIWPEFLIGKCRPLLSFSLSETKYGNRLCLRSFDRHHLSVLLHSAHVRELRAEDYLQSRQSGFPLLDLLRDWTIWLDGYFPDCDF